MTNIIETIKNKVNINKTIDKLLESKNDLKYFLVKKKDFWIPSNLVKKEGYTVINIYYNVYPVDDVYYLVKVQSEYIDDKELNIYNNTSLINWVSEGGIKDDYFWVYNIYKYYIKDVNSWIEENEISFVIPKDVDENKFSKKLLRYNFIQELVDNYNKNLLNIYKKDISYIDITDELFYYKNKKTISNIINILEKIWFSKKKTYSKIMGYKNYEITKKYQRFQKILWYYKKSSKVYPLFFEYLDSNLNQSIYIMENNEHIHKIFNINNIDDFLDTKTEYDYLIFKWNIMTYFPIYLFFLEKIFFKTFLKLRNIDKLKLSFNEKINLDKIERLPLLMWQLLANNSVLVELIKLYNIINNKVILWSKKYVLGYSLWGNLNNVDIKVDKDIKTILKEGEYSKLIKSDYISEPLEKELFKYNLDYISINEPIFSWKL